MWTRVLPWVLRVAWAALPFTAGPALSEGLRHHADAFRLASSTGAWAVWAVVLLATLVPNPVGLTVLRCAAPAVLVAVAWAAVAGGPSAVAATDGAAWAVGVAILVLHPSVAMLFVNGPAYPDERRYPLAPPAALLLGPVPVAWAAATGLPTAAVLLLASSRWIPGAAAGVVAVPAAWLFGRSLHGLSRRWAVFVPAGLVLHDPMSVTDPVLFIRAVIESVAPAPADSDALDLTHRALGLAIELRLHTVVPLTPVRGESTAATRILFTPSRPGALLDEASRRRLPVGAARR